jgi:hypothetical protein
VKANTQTVTPPHLNRRGLDKYPPVSIWNPPVPQYGPLAVLNKNKIFPPGSVLSQACHKIINFVLFGKFNYFLYGAKGTVKVAPLQYEKKV